MCIISVTVLNVYHLSDVSAKYLEKWHKRFFHDIFDINKNETNETHMKDQGNKINENISVSVQTDAFFSKPSPSWTYALFNKFNNKEKMYCILLVKYLKHIIFPQIVFKGKSCHISTDSRAAIYEAFKPE